MIWHCPRNDFVVIFSQISWGNADALSANATEALSQRSQTERRIETMRTRTAPRSISILGLSILLAFASIPKASGQATDSIIVGAVMDQAGGLVPNAKVTATNLATGVKYSATTNPAGEYRINNVPIGTYDVDAESTGMAPAKVTGVALELNRTASVNFTMEVGQASSAVNVVEAPALIDTSTAQLQNNFGVAFGLNLPSSSFFKNDTGVLNLSLLAPGVTQSSGVGYGTGPSIGGQRQTNNSFNIDGVDNNRHDVTGPLASVPNDAVAEFSLLTNQFSAEFGGSSGGIFNTVTKSGTNQLHGSLSNI